MSRSLFKELPANAPYGFGAKEHYRLVPYRSVAIDKSYPLETVLFIPKLRGVQLMLPDGRQIVHDGYVVAVDRGGLSTGDHIDFFKRSSRDDTPPAPLRSSEKRKLDAYIVDDPTIKDALRTLHLTR